MPRASHILVVDDDHAHRQLLQFVLQAHRYAVTVVEDGYAALGYLRAHTPDAIILDVGMPGLSGLHVASRIRRLRRLRDVPIMIMSSLVDDEVRLAAANCGVAQIVEKPIAGSDLTRSLSRLLG